MTLTSLYKPVVATSIYAGIDLAVDMMNEYSIRRLVVVDEKERVAGILTTDDIARNMMLSRRR